MEWISVKEGLPNNINNGCCEHDCVLVLSKQGAISFAQMFNNEWKLLFEDGVYSCVGTIGFDIKDITHWMPLPKLPKVA